MTPWLDVASVTANGSAIDLMNMKQHPCLTRDHPSGKRLCLVTQYLISLAQAANSTPAQSSGQGGGGLAGLGGNPIILMVLIFAVMYFIVIRPQSKRAKETQRMLSELKKGDEVVTSGGIIGRISGLKDNEITLQVQEGVRIRIQRSAVTGRLKTPTTEPPKNEAKAS